MFYHSTGTEKFVYGLKYKMFETFNKEMYFIYTSTIWGYDIHSLSILVLFCFSDSIRK